ncbi:hypothetical protein ACHAWC_010036 [Mediolabrus comicus]
MSSTSSVPAASGGNTTVQQNVCPCNDIECKVNIFIIESNPSGLPSTEMTKCCGLYCEKDVDNSHYCSLCGNNVCAPCSIANVSDKNSYEPLLKNVICDKHVQYCRTHGYKYREEEIPRAVSTESTESTVQVGGGVEVVLDVPKTVSHDDVKQDLSSKTHNYFPNVDISVGSTNPLAKVAKNKPLPTDPSKLTKFRGVRIPSRGGGIVLTHALNVDNLRSFALHGMKIDGMGNKGKKEICDAIVAKVTQWHEAVANGNEEAFFADQRDSCFVFNYKRLINVLLGSVMGPKLDTELAQRLTRRDLDDGIRMFQNFCGECIREYNDKNNADYGSDAHNVDDFDQDASQFDPIPPGNWQMLYKKIKQLSLEYEKKYNESKESGYHGEFGDLESLQPYLNYFHQALEESGKGGIFREAILATLPEGTFSDSTQGAPAGKRQRSNRGRKGGRGGGGRGGSKRSFNGGDQSAALDSIASKNHAKEVKTKVETIQILERREEGYRQEKDKHMASFSEYCRDGKAEAKERYKCYEERRKAKRDDADGSDSESSVDTDPEESQSSLCDKIYTAKHKAKKMKSQRKQVEGKEKKK